MTNQQETIDRAHFHAPPWPAWLAETRAPAPPLAPHLEARVLGIVRRYAEACGAQARVELDPDLGPDEHARYGLFVGGKLVCGQNTPEKFERRVLLWAQIEAHRLRRTAKQDETKAGALEAGAAEAQSPCRNEFREIVLRVARETKPEWCTVFAQAVEGDRVYVVAGYGEGSDHYGLADTLSNKDPLGIQIALGDLYGALHRCREAREAKAAGGES